MALNIKNPVVEALVAEIAEATGESKTEAIRRSLEARKRQLAYRLVNRGRGERLRALLVDEIWPLVPPTETGRRLSKEEEEEILGLGQLGI